MTQRAPDEALRRSPAAKAPAEVALIGRIRTAWVVLSLLACLLTAYVVFEAAADRDRAIAQQTFLTHCARASEHLRAILRRQWIALAACRALFDASHSVEWDEWRAFVEGLDLEHTYPGVRRLKFLEPVPRDGIAAYEARVRREDGAVHPDFGVWGLANGYAGEAVVVRFVEPEALGAREAGFDAASDPGTREAILRARDHDVVAATETYVSKGGPGRAIAAYLPVWQRHGPGSVPTLRGWIGATMRMPDVFGAAVDPAEGLGLEVFEGETADPARRIYPDAVGGAAVPRPDENDWVAAPYPTEFGGRSWTVRWWGSDTAIRAEAAPLRWSALAVGLSVSALVTGLLWSLARTRTRAEALAHRMTSSLAVARDEAMAAARAKGEFIAAVSHEIRTPLNGVLGMAHLLLESGLDPEQEDHARAIESSGKALLAILNDILDVSKIEAGKLSLDLVPFDLRTAFEETLEILAPQAEEKGLEVALRWAPATPTRYVGDPGRVRQILVNLAGNAVKFTETGHVLVSVAAKETSESDALVEVRVEDTGVGIEPDKIPLLFRTFSQADTSTTRRYGGTGLGLAISRLLARRMGGTIGVSSAPGRGSVFTFSVRLPLDLSAPREPAPPPELASARLLVADDAAVVRETVREQAESWGLAVDEAGDAAAAMQALRRAAGRGGAPLAFALLDRRLPGLDVPAFAKEVRGDPRLAATRLVLLAESSRGGALGVAAEAGLDAVLMKPLRAAELRAALLALAAPRAAGSPVVTRQVLAAARRTSASSSGSGFVLAAAGPHRRVLLAEDNPVNQRVAEKMLERLGCVVDVVANGREAVSMALRFPYDLVLMDCQMPELDGYEAAGSIRRGEPPDRRVPIVALTAHASDSDRQRCLAAGMDDYLPKPIASEDLRRMVARWTAPGRPAGAAPPPASPPADPASKP